MRMKLRGILCCVAFLAALAGCNGERRAAERERLRTERQELLNRVGALEEEQRFLNFIKEIHATEKRYLVLDTRTAKGSLRIGNNVLREFSLVLDGCPRPDGASAEQSGSYVLPKGRIEVIAKRKAPVWYKPDWMYQKDAARPPPVNSSERLIRGPLGAYAIFFGGGFVIHGRPTPGAPPAPLEHACIILEDDDLRVVHNLIGPGSIAYVR